MIIMIIMIIVIIVILSPNMKARESMTTTDLW
jgi:hypothetical protein